MINEKLVTYSLFVYFLAWVLYTIHYLRDNKRFYKIPLTITGIGFCLSIAGFITRWIESYNLGAGHFPVANLYEALVFFTMIIIGIFLVMEIKYQFRWSGTFILPIAFITLAYTSFLNKNIEPLVPALQSNWLTVHVITSFLGYAGFAVGFGLGLVYLLFLKKSENNTKLLDDIDQGIYISIAFGFITLTLGIITGAVWANYAWGSYWSWDPKETWSLITWLVYGTILHARFTRGWKGKRTAYFVIIGFAVTLFCFLGVNLFLSGLHSYAS